MTKDGDVDMRTLAWHNLTAQQQQQLLSFQLLSSLEPAQLQFLQQPQNAAALVNQLQQNPNLGAFNGFFVKILN